MFSKRIMSKAAEIYLLMFATVHLLYVGFSGYTHVFDAKVVTFCTLNILLLLCAGISLVFLFNEKQIDFRAKIKKSTCLSHIFVILYLFFTLISGVTSTHFPDTIFGVSRFEGIFTISLYCLSFVLISIFPCKKKYLLVAFSIAVTLFSALCVIQLHGHNPLSLYPAGTSFYDAGIIYTTAFIGTIGNTNLVGAFICLTLPFMTIIMLKAKEKERLLLLIPVALLSFTALRMGVTSTLLGLAAGFFVILPHLLKMGKKMGFMFLLCLVIILSAILICIYVCPPESGFLSEVSEIMHGNISDSFGSGRIRIWKNVLSEIPDSPILGKGPDTMQKEKFPPFERYYPARGKVMRTGIDVAHNEFLNVLYHQGILGLFAYLGFIICTLKVWFKNRHDTLVFALGASLICYLVQSFFTFSMCVSAPYFWIAAGLIVGISRENIEKPTR